MQNDSNTSPVARRELLAGAGVVGLSGLAHAQIAGAHSTDASRLGRSVLTRTCVIAPTATPGPFYVNSQLLRKDITEGQPGLPLTVILKIVREQDCQPIMDAVADLWHCHAVGAYSGFASEGTAGESWLRGIQVSDVNGIVCFETIFPGWYTGRTTHFHLKVHLNDQTVLTTQLYFKESLPDPIYANIAPYSSHGPRDTTNAQDFFYTPETEMKVIPKPGATPGLMAGMVVAAAQ